MTASTPRTDKKPTINIVQVAIRLSMLLILSAALLFGAAGRLDWPAAWIYILFMVGFTFVSRVQLLRTHPDLAAERAASFSKDDAKPWDRLLMPFVAIWGPLLTLLVAGLDLRYGWSPPVATGVQVAALIVVITGYLIGHWATMINRFFSGTVRIQTERDHTVVDDGPYRFVRHPGYAAGVLANPAIALLLGSLWGLVPALLVVAGLVVRTALEDRTLQAELPGYADYARRVRYRLLPGLW